MKRAWLAGGIVAAGAVVVASLLASPRPLSRADTRVPALSSPVLYYRDPMHPSYTSKTPGRAPDCGMELEPVYAAISPGSPIAGAAPLESQAVQVSLERQQMIGVRLGRVERSRVTGTLHAFGRVTLDETKVFPLVSGGDGWVTGIAAGSTMGSSVRRGQPLLSVYGRDYVIAQRSFLYALQASEHPAPAPSDLQTQTELNLQEARLVLQSLGFGPDQIQELVRTREVLPQTTLVAPASGVVLARNVFENQRF